MDREVVIAYDIGQFRFWWFLCLPQKIYQIELFDCCLGILLSLIQQYRTGTTSIVSISIVIPPKEGIAIGTIISEPRPVEVRTGISARIVVAVVIRQGRILRIPA